MSKFIYFFLLIPFTSFGQNYTSYFTGNTTDVVTTPAGGICLMGGATEDDNAMRWFLRKVNGGDILVLRASGSSGYNGYLYSTLGIPVNSVETIVCNNAAASNDPYILRKIQQAEAIWFAGGDQWAYVSYWRNSPVASAINQAIQQRHVVVGGTSAGMAIQGKHYFSARNGSVTSATALANPYSNLVTVDSAAFLTNSRLHNVITDTHFDNPDRKGRLVTFLSRIFTDYGVYAKAIACDEYTAVCIDANGTASVFGNYPANDDNAYFIQSNCELLAKAPENCTPGNALTWNLGGQALRVYRIKGNSTGSNTFNLNSWQAGNGGSWLNWSVANGTFSEQNGNAITCSALSVAGTSSKPEINLYPNPTTGSVFLTTPDGTALTNRLNLYNAMGQEMAVIYSVNSRNEMMLNMEGLENGVYYLIGSTKGNTVFKQKIIKSK